MKNLNKIFLFSALIKLTVTMSLSFDSEKINEIHQYIINNKKIEQPYTIPESRGWFSKVRDCVGSKFLSTGSFLRQTENNTDVSKLCTLGKDLTCAYASESTGIPFKNTVFSAVGNVFRSTGNKIMSTKTEKTLASQLLDKAGLFYMTKSSEVSIRTTTVIKALAKSAVNNPQMDKELHNFVEAAALRGHYIAQEAYKTYIHSIARQMVEEKKENQKILFRLNQLLQETGLAKEVKDKEIYITKLINFINIEKNH